MTGKIHTTSSAEIYRLFRQHPHICTDSRKVLQGSLFFGLTGDNFDGNLFANQALEKGAAYSVIDNPDRYTGEKTLLVDDVLDALQQLAKDYRNSLNIPVIGITGTNGKTTTKELVYTALNTRFRTHATKGNLNNHIGVPLTLLNISPETEIAIIEMGANHKGEIAALCEIARPTHGIITNIGKAHLEGFGGIDGVIKTKKELYDFLTDNSGTVFVNADDPLLMDLSKNLTQITYGTTGISRYSGAIAETDPFLSLKLLRPTSIEIQTQLFGSYNFSNVMAAICIAGHFEADLNHVKLALESYVPSMNRSQIVKTAKNTLLLDAYNANPSSMAAALNNFALKSPGTKMVILGDMFELGDVEEQEHENILKLALSAGFEKTIVVGAAFLKAAKKAPEAAMAFSSVSDLKNYLSECPPADKTILIKGSRGMKLETITDEL